MGLAIADAKRGKDRTLKIKNVQDGIQFQIGAGKPFLLANAELEKLIRYLTRLQEKGR